MTREVRRHEGERAVSEMGGKAVDAMRAAITHTPSRLRDDAEACRKRCPRAAYHSSAPFESMKVSSMKVST